MKRQLTHAEILEAALKSERASTYRTFPGVVQAYHAGGPGKRATVDVQVTVNDVRFDLDTNEALSEPWDVITGVPVLWPRFGGFVIKGPMQQGDEVTIIAYDLDPSAFRTTGQVSDPDDVKRHGGNYWCALPCGIADPNGTASDGASVLTIGVDGGQAQIQISGQTIQLGGSGGDFVALASKVNAAIKAWAEWAASGTGTGYTPPTPATQPGTPPGTVDTGSPLIEAQ